MPQTTYIDTILNKLLFGKTGSPYTPPATLYVAASTTTPTQAGANFTEPSGNGYARVAVTNDTTNWVPATSQPGTGQSQANGTQINFPAATGGAASWGTVTYVGIFDASSGGNLIAYAALTVAQTIGGGDTLSFAVQALQFSVN